MDPFTSKLNATNQKSLTKLTLDQLDSSLETTPVSKKVSLPSDYMAHAAAASAFYLLCGIAAGLLEDDFFIGAIVGLGFGQLTVTAIWLSLRSSGYRVAIAILAVAIEIVAMLMMEIFFANFPDSVFNLTLVAASLAFFSIILGTISLIRKYYRITLALDSENGSNDVKSAQYGILDLLIAMSVVAILTAGFNSIIKFKSSSRDDVTEMIQIFGLIICFYFLLAWPVVVACLSRRWIPLTLFATVACIGLFLVQVPAFNTILGFLHDAWGMIASLDLPFVLCVLTHATIARCYGYRLTVLNENR